MSCNSYKYSDTCGVSIYAPCVYVERTATDAFPSMSSLVGDECADLDSVITDLYDLVEKSYVDMSSYNKGCLDYSPTLDADITPIQVLNKLTEEVCTLQPLEGLLETDGTLKSIPEFDISNLTLNCLASDPCGATPTTLEELLQTIINKLCVCCP